ncbi:MAG: hypothetical protein HQM09_21670 [Candidatus Riflebacteria bacterium]|nr:hypothetical protein [Candidatus Riflebacteria bacterium]
MTCDTLSIELLSDSTFGTGRGSPGEVDVDIVRDDQGLPMIPGKIIHGLLRDEWFAMESVFPVMTPLAGRVLGVERDLQETSILRIGNARLSPDVLDCCEFACGRNNRMSGDLLFLALTGIRSQTAVDHETGVPERTTLRQSRVSRSDLIFYAPLTWLNTPTKDEMMLLARLSMAVRHAGIGRTRGRGHIRCSIDGNPDLTKQLARLQEAAA